MNVLNFNEHREIARKMYNDANCNYDGMEYIYHIDMVAGFVMKYEKVFLNELDYQMTYIASNYHDCIEDCKQSFNDIKDVAGIDVANITLGVTDVANTNRLLKHLNTMGRTVKDYRAIILKMADLCANGSYSKSKKSKMYKKYVTEYTYRKAVFQIALSWYTQHLDQTVLDEFWMELDEIHLKQ